MMNDPNPLRQPIRPRRRLGQVLVLATFVSVIVFARGIWWPLPFEALARRALAEHTNQDALDWLNWATWLAPERGETAFLRARAYRRIGQMEFCAAALKRADQLRVPVNRLHREQWLALAQSGQLRQAESHLSELLIDPRGDSEEICDAFVLGYVRTQRETQALQLLQSWISDWGNHARPLILRAKIWSLKSMFAEAEADLRRAVQVEPANSEAVMELAKALRRGNHFDEASKLFERNLKSRQYRIDAHLGLALCLKALGEQSRVLPLLETAVQLDQDHPEGLRELGRFHLEQGHYKEAVNVLDQAVRIAPRHEEGHYLLAQALNESGQADQAKSHFDFVQKVRTAMQEVEQCEGRFAQNPRDVDALVRAGEILLEVSDPEEGVFRLLTALEISPKNSTARKLLAEHYARRATTEPRFSQLAESFRDNSDESKTPTP